MDDIERRQGLNRRDFERDFLKPKKPVIVSGLVEHWPANKRWSLDYFANQFGNKTVRFDGREWQLQAFIDQLKNHPDGTPSPYLKEVKLKEQFSELYSDIRPLELAAHNLLGQRLLPAMLRLERGRKALFIGAAGGGYRKLHWDLSHLNVFISQIVGDKEFFIFPPAATPCLYPQEGYENVSRIEDVEAVDLTQFPRFAELSPIRVTVRAGETLFLPANWWHTTRIYGPNISLAESSFDLGHWEQRVQWLLQAYRDAGVSGVKRAALKGYLALIKPVLAAKVMLSPTAKEGRPQGT